MDDSPEGRRQVTGRMFEAINNVLLDMLAALTRKDYDDRRPRQAQGQAEAEGKYRGRAEDVAHNTGIARMPTMGQLTTTLYCLVTLYGEQPIDHFNHELRKKRSGWSKRVDASTNAELRRAFEAEFAQPKWPPLRGQKRASNAGGATSVLMSSRGTDPV
jgi:hypothetical protein